MKALQNFIEKVEKLKELMAKGRIQMDNEDERIRNRYIKLHDKSQKDYIDCIDGVTSYFLPKEVEILKEKQNAVIQETVNLLNKHQRELVEETQKIRDSIKKEALKAIFETNEKTISQTISLLKNITEALKTLPHNIKDAVNEISTSILKENLKEDETFIKEYVSEASTSTIFKVLRIIKIEEQIKASQKAVENFELLYKTTNKERITQLKLF